MRLLRFTRRSEGPDVDTAERGTAKTSPAGATHGDVVAAFVARELQSEYERRKVLDAGAVGVITSSGTLATLVFAFAAFASVGETSDGVLDPWAAGALVLSLAVFVAAATFALFGSRLVPYDVGDEDDLLAYADWAVWEDPGYPFVWQVTRLDLKTISTLRRGNNQKADWVRRALASQVLAILLLAFAVLLAILPSWTG